MNWAQFKDPVSTCVLLHCGGILVSHTRGGCVAGSSPFTVMTNIFVTEFSETFRKNSIDLFETVPKKFEVLGKTYPAE